jgi:hypothetical protein
MGCKKPDVNKIPSSNPASDAVRDADGMRRCVLLPRHAHHREEKANAVKRLTSLARRSNLQKWNKKVYEKDLLVMVS